MVFQLGAPCSCQNGCFEVVEGVYNDDVAGAGSNGEECSVPALDSQHLAKQGCSVVEKVCVDQVMTFLAPRLFS